MHAAASRHSTCLCLCCILIAPSREVLVNRLAWEKGKERPRGGLEKCSQVEIMVIEKMYIYTRALSNGRECRTSSLCVTSHRQCYNFLCLQVLLLYIMHCKCRRRGSFKRGDSALSLSHHQYLWEQERIYARARTTHSMKSSLFDSHADIKTLSKPKLWKSTCSVTLRLPNFLRPEGRSNGIEC